MMQALAEMYADGTVPEGPQRNVVSRRTAMDAVMQIFAIIDEEVEAHRMPEDSALDAVTMLMLVREYVFPLPDVGEEEAVLRDDMQTLTQMLDEQWN